MAAMAGDPSPVAGVVPRCGHQANMEKDQAIDALEPNTEGCVVVFFGV
jgi:hypothetical protein